MNGYGAVPEYGELESYMYRDKRSTMNLIGKIDSFPELGNTIVIGGKIYVKKQEPLSDAQIAELWGDKHSGKTYMVKNFARAIEKAHGIGGGE